MSEQRYRDFFQQADTDGSGFLTVHELVAMLKRNGYTGGEEAIKSCFTSADRSDDDKISFDEFMQAMGCQNERVHAGASMRSIFRKFDADNSGSIDRAELQNVLSEMGSQVSEADVERIIQLADQDGSQSLNYEEFVKELCG